MAQLGRISGPLLQENLLRNGVDLAFETDLLYIDVTNNRIGIRNNAPSNDLHSPTEIRTTNLITDTEANIANLNFQNSTIQPFPGSLFLDSNSVITSNNIQTDDLNIDFNRIKSISPNTNIEIRPNGTGTTEVLSNLNVYGNLTATGSITLGGNINFGNNNLDNVTVSADIASDVVPNQDLVYSLGTSTQRWADIEAVLLNGQEINSTVATVLGVDVGKRQGKLWYVSTNGDNTNVGDHQQGPFRTIDYAVTQATAGDVIYVYPGEYEETCPITVPTGVVIIGHDQRNTIVTPPSSASTTDIFLLNGETQVQNLTIKDFFYDNVLDEGYAFRFAPGGKVTSRSPYIQNVTVITRGSTTSASDPLGFNTGDAGKGILVDGRALANDTREASMLFHAVTLITPGVDAITATNGVRIEWLNSFTYYANRGVYATNGLGRLDDNFQPRYGVEMRSIGSANVYGNYGVVADGADNLIYLIMHNFGYVGSGLDSSNDITLRIQANEVVESNNASIVYQGQSENGDFRVGDSFYIDFTKGSQTFDINDIPVVGVDTITVTTGTDVTYLDLNYIQTGNIRLIDNSLATINGDLNITAASGAINLNNDVSILKDLYASGNLTIGGTLISFGNNQTIDTITFESEIDTNLNPKTTDVYNIGSETKQWANVWLTEIFNDNLNITNNFIETLESNADLELRASGTGIIYINDVAVIENDLTVNTQTNLFGPLNTFTGGFNLTGGFTQTGDFSLDGNASITETLTVNSAVQFEDILINDNTISTTATNSDLNLYANGASVIRVPVNNVTITPDLFVNEVTFTTGIVNTSQIEAREFDNGSIIIDENNITSTILNNDLNLNATGIISVDSNDVLIDNDLTLSAGTARLLNTNITGSLTHLGNRTQTGNTQITGSVSITEIYSSDREVQLENILINDNFVTTTASNSNLELYANGSGLILLPSNDATISNDLTVVGDISVNNLSAAGIYYTEIFNTAQTSILDNSILSNTGNLFLRANGTGVVNIPNNDVVITNDLTVNQTTSTASVDINGLLTRNGNTVQTGNISLTGNLSISGLLTVPNFEFENVLINDNIITTTISNSDLDLRAAGTGVVRLQNEVIANQNVTVNGLLNTASIVNAQTIESNTFTNGSIIVDDNNITVTSLNSDLVLTADGLGIVRFENLDVTQAFDVDGLTTLLDVFVNGSFTNIGDFDLTGNFVVNGNVNFNGVITVDRQVQIENVLIDDNIITTIDSNSDLELRAAGTGSILIAQDNLQIDQALSVNGLTSTTTLNVLPSNNITSYSYEASNVEIRENRITNFVTNNDLVISGTKASTTSTNVVIENNANQATVSELLNTNVNGTLTHNGARNQTGNYQLTGDATVGLNLSVSSFGRFANVLIQGNKIVSFAPNADLILSTAPGVGKVTTLNNVELGQDLNVTGTISSTNISNIQLLLSDEILTTQLKIFDNNIDSTGLNTDIVLSANGTGIVALDSNNLEVVNALTSGTADFSTTNITGLLDLTGNSNHTGNLSLTGNMSVTANLNSAFAEFESIDIINNTIRTFVSNSDLELRATRNVVIDDNMTITNSLTSSSVDSDTLSVTTGAGITSPLFQTTSSLQISSNIVESTVGNLVLAATDLNRTVNFNSDTNIDQTLTVSGDSNLDAVIVNGTIEHTGNRSVNDFDVTGNLTVTGDIIVSEVQFEEININDNVIKTTSSNTDLELRANGTGEVVADVHARIAQNLELNGVANINDLTVQTTIQVEKVDTDDIEISDNRITTVVTNANLELRASGTGSINLEETAVYTDSISNTQGNDIEFNIDGTAVISGSGALDLAKGTTAEKTVNNSGDLRYNTDANLFEGFSTDRITFGGVYSSDRLTSVTATDSSNELIFQVNGSTVSTVTENNFVVNGIILPNIDIQDSSIIGTLTNTDLTIDSGTASVNIEDLTFTDNSIINNSNNPLIFVNQGSGYVVLSTTTGIQLPAGGDAARTNIEVGDTRWNTDTQVLETYDGNVYVSSAGTENNITPEEFNNLLFEYTLIFG